MEPQPTAVVAKPQPATSCRNCAHQAPRRRIEGGGGTAVARVEGAGRAHVDGRLPRGAGAEGSRGEPQATDRVRLAADDGLEGGVG